MRAVVSRLFVPLTRAIVERPRSVLALLGLVTLLAGLELPQLQADSSPRALLASADPAQQALEDDGRARFGSITNVVAVIVSGDDLLRREPLQWVHDLARALEALPHVERVDAITELAWPRPGPDDLTLDEVDADAPEESPSALSAAADLVAARPDAFPAGLLSLGERRAETQLEPLIPGSRVRPEDVLTLREVLASTTHLDRRLVSRDRRHLLVAVQFSDALQKHEDVAGAVGGVEARLAAHPPPGGTRVQLSGLPVIRTSMARHMRADQRLLIPGTLLASFVVLALSFRWAPAVWLPLIAVGVTALWLLSGMAIFGEPLNVLNNMLPALVIIIGLNEAVHLVGRYMEESVRDPDRRRALQKTVRAMGAACLTTTATSAVGMFSLIVSRTEMLRRFGIVGAAGLFLAYAVALLLVPAALALVRRPPARGGVREARRGRIEAVLSLVTGVALRRPLLVLGLAGASALAAALAANRVAVDSALLDQFAADDPVHRGVRLLEAEFEGVRPLEITVRAERAGGLFEPSVLQALERVRSWAEAQPGVLAASDPSGPLALGWAAVSGLPARSDELHSAAQVQALAQLIAERDGRVLGPLLTRDGTQARIRVKLRDIGSHATGAFVERAQQKLVSELAPLDGLTTWFAGDAYMGSRGLDFVVADLSGSVLVAGLMIFVLLTLLLRDLPLALLAVPGNLLPQVWTLGWMALRGMPLNASSAIIFSLSIGLAVDGSIHLVSRFREERVRRATLTSAIARAVHGSGRNVVVSSVALVLGFAVMRLSNFVPVQRFAELITVSMAGSLIATLAIQPALLQLCLVRRALAAQRAARPA